MATRSDQDIDDDFSDIYKEYTGPLGSKPVTNDAQYDKVKSNYINKRSNLDSDEEEEARDPNAVPTDFTSREAKVWEAKSKATERNWKKRKEEEMICKICGESGHFTQGCPSTLGANRKSQDFFERVPARDPQVKALFTEKVIQRIEKDIGCKLKMEEKFLIVSGKDRLILAKGVDAVHKVIKGEGDLKGSSSSHSHRSRSRSPEQSPAGSRLRRSESQRSYPSHPRETFESQRSYPGHPRETSESQRSFPGHPRETSHYKQRFSRQEKILEDRARGDHQKFSRGSPQAYCNDGARSHSSHSKSPAHPPYTGSSYGSYDSNNHSVGGYVTDGWDNERQASDLPGRQTEYIAFSQTLEDLELEYKREATELGRIRDNEEDEENFKHREALREVREDYMKKLAILRDTHTRQWEEFLRLDSQRHQQQSRQQMSTTGFGGYKQHTYSDYDASSANRHHTGANIPIDSRPRYPNHMEGYPSRPHDSYGEFQHQRRGDFGKAYNRY